MSHETISNRELVKKTTRQKRPQEPTPPYPYHEEEVSFVNKTDEITLSGTLTLPTGQGPFPAVLLISGMGPNDRDYTNCRHKIFLVLADLLTRNNIAVLRYDKRGIGKSSGTYDYNSTTKDYSRDAIAAFDYLKTRPEINKHQIGLIGHSEGSTIAAMIVTQSKEIAFFISMAGTGTTDIKIIADQSALQLHADGASHELIEQDRILREKILTTAKEEQNQEIAKKQMTELFTSYWLNLSQELKKEATTLLFAFTPTKINTMITMYSSPWYRFFLHLNPGKLFEKIKIPVLALNGNRDWIIYEKALDIIGSALKKAGNPDYKTIVLPNLNHQFRTCVTGAIREYAMIEETIAPSALNLITNWILERTSNKTHQE